METKVTFHKYFIINIVLIVYNAYLGFNQKASGLQIPVMMKKSGPMWWCQWYTAHPILLLPLAPSLKLPHVERLIVLVYPWSLMSFSCLCWFCTDLVTFISFILHSIFERWREKEMWPEGSKAVQLNTKFHFDTYYLLYWVGMGLFRPKLRLKFGSQYHSGVRDVSGSWEALVKYIMLLSQNSGHSLRSELSSHSHSTELAIIKAGCYKVRISLVFCLSCMHASALPLFHYVMT